MNATPSFTRFNFQNEEDLSFGMFGIPNAMNHPGSYQGLQPTPYADPFPLHTQHPPSDHLSSSNPPFGFLSRSVIASYDEHTRLSTPYPVHPKFESPDLSSGSSSTPDTHESQQLVTPKNATALRQAPDSEDEIDDFDDDLSQLAGPALKKSGRQRTKEGASPKEKEGKRRHFLHRNRVAAMKCRKKKKEWVSDLEETKSGLENQNTHLHMELDGLVDEASRIRAQLMAHANCNDSNINKWIENEAKRFVIGTGERYDQILAHFGPAQGMNGQQDSLPSSSEYTVISPLATPSQLPPTPHNPGQLPSTPAFYPPNAPSMNTPGCYPVPSREAAPFVNGFDQTPGVDEEPDYDGMPLSLYDHQVS
ncbi:hypothetical protein F4678DRAFT_465348 [Xylaria arbuscula]|nr:hypothetical protein F4678DRAFT_465348 [Xylaria arbuscula]